MHPRRILFAALGAASITSLAPPVGAEGEAEPPRNPGGHVRCKASNATFAKTTRCGTASTTYETKGTRAEASSSFTR